MRASRALLLALFNIDQDEERISCRERLNIDDRDLWKERR